jgi:hypothetical protein
MWLSTYADIATSIKRLAVSWAKGVSIYLGFEEQAFLLRRKITGGFTGRYDL